MKTFSGKRRLERMKFHPLAYLQEHFFHSLTAVFEYGVLISLFKVKGALRRKMVAGSLPDNARIHNAERDPFAFVHHTVSPDTCGTNSEARDKCWPYIGDRSSLLHTTHIWKEKTAHRQPLTFAPRDLGQTFLLKPSKLLT